MSWETWALFVATETVLCLTPGPAVLLVLSEGLRGGVGRSFWSSVGILSANAMYFALSAAGLSAVLLASYQVFDAIKWIGAAYLVYLGLSMVLRRRSIVSERAVPQRRSRRGLLNGFAVQAANPKALIFFTALLPQFVDPSSSASAQIAVLGISSVAVEFFVLSGYGFIAGRMSSLARRPRFAAIADRVSGVMLIGAGARLALARRT